MAKGEKPILSVRVHAELLETLDAAAEEAGCGRAEIVERCLWNGLLADQQLRRWLQGRLSGPLLQLITHPKVLKAALAVIGDEVDSTVLKVRKGAIQKRRAGVAKAKPAIE